MQIEDIIYDAAVLKMGVCLEGFLRHHLHRKQSDRLPSMIEEYCTDRDHKTRDWMYKIWKARNDAAHPDEDVAPSGEDTDPVFDFDSFQKIRRIGEHLDARLRKATGHDTGMSEIMISSSLPYDMGNAGDLLKHGALATFVDWFLESGENQIRYADPFGGRPWGYIVKDEIIGRMRELSSRQLVFDRAQPDWSGKNRYYGSSHAVLNIAKWRNKGATVLGSDRDKLARSDLKASGISLIEETDQSYNPKNGFEILDKQHDGRFDLILLDPFADFLLNEFGYRRESPTTHPESISKSVERNPGLCVMLFVLDMKDNSIHKKYAQQRSEYSGISFCLRCPKMKRDTGVDGEAGYNMEILLISKRFAKGSDSVSELKTHLLKLGRALEEVLSSRTGRIEFWPPD